MAREKTNETKNCIFKINNRPLGKPTKKKINKENAKKQLEMKEETLQLIPHTNTQDPQGPL